MVDIGVPVVIVDNDVSSPLIRLRRGIEELGKANQPAGCDVVRGIARFSRREEPRHSVRGVLRADEVTDGCERSPRYRENPVFNDGAGDRVWR